MNAASTKRERTTQFLALVWLLGLGVLALVGPYGLLSWNEQAALLDKRQDQIVSLKDEGAVLANKVELLDPSNVDPDLATELVRGNLNVAHPDEFIIDLEAQP